MSQKLLHHKQARYKAAELERKMTENISKELHRIYANCPSAVKAVAEETGGAFTTVKKWYEGQNPPNLGHFIILCRHYEGVLKAFLILSGNEDLNDFLEPKNNDHLSPAKQIQSIVSGKDIPENVTLNGTIKTFNHRQRWFLDRVCRKITPSIEACIDRWDTSERTIRRDIAELIRLKVIKRVGAKKKGGYILL